MEISLKLADLTKSFGSLDVLRGVNLDVYKGELLTILGTSGGGKTTLLRLIAGFDRPDAGSIQICERVVADDSQFIRPESRRVGIVPQEAALFPHLNVSKNIAFGLSDLSKAESADRVKEMLALVKMEHFAEHQPHQLSGGQAQRVALARALAPRPDLILLDEPFAALDAQMRGQIRDDVHSALGVVGATAIMVTHDQDEALSIADRVAVLRNGVIAQVGTPREVYNSPADEVLAVFLGDAVVIDGVYRNGKVDTYLGSLAASEQFREGTTGTVAIRPENLYLQPDLNGTSQVIGRQFFGHDAMIEVQTQHGVVRARTSGPLSPEIGMKVTVWVRGAVSFFPAK
jgi:iron(III) transport system ATP-binding protein